MGKIYKSARRFIEQNASLLLSKNTAIYFCSAYSDTLPKVIKKNIPAALIKHASCIISFGGKPPFTSTRSQSWIRTENIDDFINKIHKI